MSIKELQAGQADAADRAIAAVREAMIELGGLLLAEDGYVRARAATGLREMGWHAGGAVAVALSRAAAREPRLAMLTLIRRIGSAYNPDVTAVLERIRDADPDEVVARAAGQVLDHLIEREYAAEIEATIWEAELETARWAEARGAASDGRGSDREPTAAHRDAGLAASIRED